MNAPFVVAQANSTGSTAGSRSLRTIKVLKPQGDQAVTVQLGYDQNYKLDLSAIANEKITLVHIGEKLIILFDNKSTVTVEPFFDSMNAPLSNVTVESNGRDFTGSEFASAFPITTDQSVLTAAGAAGAAGNPASGADFHGPSVDPLDEPNPLPLLGQEELLNFVTTPQLGVAPPITTTVETTVVTTPSTVNPAVISGAVDEGGLFLTSIGAVGNDLGVATDFTGNAGNGQSLMNAVTWGSAGPGAVPFQFTVSTGDSLLSLGMLTHDASGTVIEVDIASISGNTLTAYAGGLGGIAVFTLSLNTDGSWTFQDLAPINHTPFGDNIDTDNQLDLSSLIKAVAGDSSSLTLAPSTLVMTMTDDIPVLRAPVEDGEFQFVPMVTGVVDEGGLTADAIGSIGNNPGASTTAAGGPGSLDSLVDFGADGPNATAPYQFAVVNGGDLTGLAMFTQNSLGTPVQVDTALISGDTLTAYAGGTGGIVVFTLTIHNDGSWEFTDLAPINHAPFADNGNFANTFDLSSLIKAVDFDGDSVPLSNDFKITIIDDTPVANDDEDSVTANSPLIVDGNVIAGVGGSDANATDGVSDAIGADGLASITWTNTSNGAVPGQHGTLTVDANGNYSYVLNNSDAAVQSLSDSQTLTDTFTYTITDADGDTASATLTVTIFGTNQPPTAVADTNWAKEDTNTSASGNVLLDLPHGGAPLGSFADTADTDPNAGDTLSVSAVTGGSVGSALAGTYGSVTINANGTYTYALNNGAANVQALAVGQTVLDTFTYTVSDGHGGTASATLSVSVFGTNDNPTAAADTNWAKEDTDTSASGNVLQNLNHGGAPLGSFADTADTDPDTLDSLTVSAVAGGSVGSALAGTYGSVTINANGTYTYALNNGAANVQALTEGQTVLDTFTYTVSDGHGGTSTANLTIKIFGTNDTPTAPTLTPSTSVVHDETPGIQTAADPNPADDVAGSSLPPTFLTLFSAIGAARGSDPDVAVKDDGAIGFAASAANLVTLTGGSFGGDGPAASNSVVYALTVTNGTFSGVSTTEGTQIFLYNGTGPTAGLILGRVGNEAGASDTPNSSGTVAFALAIDPATGKGYSAEYLSLQNPTAGSTAAALDDQITLTAGAVKMQVTYTDSTGDQATSTPINVGQLFGFQDDGPSANAVTKSLVPAGHDTNLMLILDVSGSMGDASGLTGLTRLDVLKAAVNELFEQYGDLGNVRVQIVEFSSSASQVGTSWMTLDQAKAAVDALTDGGNTNYDAAVTLAESIFSSAGKLATAGVQNVSYFMSDGVPNLPSGSVGINASEEATWTTFLNTNHIDSFALGMGSGVTQSALNPLAFNGQTNTNTNSIVVTDLSQLTATLVGTIASTSGNLLSDGVLPGSFGADSGYVKSITGDGTTYTYNPAAGGSISVSGTNHGSFDTTTNIETVTLASGGVLTMVMDNGTFSYTAPANVSAGFTDTVPFVLTDNDGDTAGNTLTIVVSTQDHHPIVRDDHVITNAPNQSGQDQIVIPDYALLFNDSDPEGQTITVTGVSGAVDGSVSHAGVNVTFREESNGANDGGSFTYTGSTTSPAASDTAEVTVDRSQNGSTLTGTGLDDILIGRDGTNNTINANEGDDVLIGGTGNDTLNGGASNDLLVGNGGNDTLIGGPGSDSLIGGAGADHFRFNASSEGMDHIMDFSGTGGQGDVIDILGSAFGGLSTGTLSASLFVSNASGNFTNGTQRFSFDTTTHTLYYDADGNGAGARIALAHLENGANVTNTDIHIV